ncbi:MAG: hypothetical protein E1N59_1252 [Puniceicoccaceae bacterium 5H]|nr:MAG: hypothetical protein E1N59_1252 [Puniceicoccaceae bacterium 5H]
MKKALSPILILAFWLASWLQAAPAQQPELYAVKIHADWCVVCKRIEPAFQEAQAELQGQPVQFLRFDLTNDETKTASATKARELGLTEVFEGQHKTGIIVLYDPAQKKIVEILKVNRSGHQMAEAIRQKLS